MRRGGAFDAEFSAERGPCVIRTFDGLPNRIRKERIEKYSHGSWPRARGRRLEEKRRALNAIMGAPH